MSKYQGVESTGGGGGEIVFSRPSPFDDFPEDCISNIISFTTPRDACVVASVSKTFESAVNSDYLWEKFLPPNHSSLFPGSRVFSSKKELYFALCDGPVLIEDGKKSFWLEKASGKRCVMLSAKQLAIKWGSNPQYWQWISIPESRFEKVAELINANAFKIHGWMNTRILSRRTHYSAYVVYKLRDRRRGLQDSPIQVGIGLKKHEIPKRFICFDESKDWDTREVVKSEKREDGWVEAEIGEFFNEGGLMGLDEIELSIIDIISRNWKSGVIIQGIEFRPKENL